jgi:hypothetical protein
MRGFRIFNFSFAAEQFLKALQYELTFLAYFPILNDMRAELEREIPDYLKMAVVTKTSLEDNQVITSKEGWMFWRAHSLRLPSLY